MRPLPARNLTLRSLLLGACAALVLAGVGARPATGETSAASSSGAGHLLRMAQEHQDDEPVASAAATLAPRLAVSSSSVDYGPATGLLAHPEETSEGLPAVIVIHEWWGLNDNIEAMTERIAGEGYLALAVDLYGGEVAETRDDAMRLMRSAMESTDSAFANLEAAIELLEKRGATAVGTIGWCFGGGWSLQAALRFGERVDAAVMYYGRVVTDEAQLAALEAPLLGIFGAEDRGIPVAGVRSMESALRSLGKDAAIHVYEGADHAFANPSGTRYQAEAAEDAWQETVAFFARHLR